MAWPRSTASTAGAIVAAVARSKICLLPHDAKGPVADFRKRELELAAVGFQQNQEKIRQNRVNIEQTVTAQNLKMRETSVGTREAAVKKEEINVDVVIEVKGFLIKSGQVNVPKSDYSKIRNASAAEKEGSATEKEGSAAGKKDSDDKEGSAAGKKDADNKEGSTAGKKDFDDKEGGDQTGWSATKFWFGVTMGGMLGMLINHMKTEEDKAKFLKAFFIVCLEHALSKPIELIERTKEVMGKEVTKKPGK